jgi:hypothetical protein
MSKRRVVLLGVREMMVGMNVLLLKVEDGLFLVLGSVGFKEKMEVRSVDIATVKYREEEDALDDV